MTKSAGPVEPRDSGGVRVVPRALPLAPEFRIRLRAAPAALLCLDYDGTLAPFCDWRETARPWPGVVPLLQRIAAAPGARVVVVSGREANTVARWLEPFRPHEIWGVHGLERRDRDGRLERPELPERTRAAIAQSAAELKSLGDCVESKHGAVAVHWLSLIHISEPTRPY